MDEIVFLLLLGLGSLVGLLLWVRPSRKGSAKAIALDEGQGGSGGRGPNSPEQRRAC